MKKSSFIEGTVIATLAIFITKILGMLYVIPFYATVGVKGSALYAYAYNIYVLFLDISSAGLPVAMSKIIKEYNTLGLKEAKVRAYHLGKRLITFFSVACFIILFVFAREVAILILGDLEGGNTISDVAYVIRCVSFAILVIPYLSISKGYLQGHNIINISSISQVIEQVVRITLILLGSYISLNILHLSLTTSVGVAVFGAFAGGFAAMLYILKNIRKNKEELNLTKNLKKDKISDKDIIKKIISYAVPFIIIDIAVSIYSFVDMVLISRTMNFLHYDARTTEFITTSVTTWAPKIGMIVNSIAMGLTVSLIPNIVEAFTLKKWEVVSKNLNNAFQIVFVTCIPMVVGICFLAGPIWSIFYGYNELGTKVLAFQIFTTLTINLNMVTSSTLQGLNKFKGVYFTTLLGYITNALLDVPCMLICNYMHINPFYGALIATIIGSILSVSAALIILKKEHNLKYGKMLSSLKRLIIPTILMSIVVVTLKMLIPLNIESKTSCILYVGIISVVGAIIYLTLLYKNKLLEDIFGKEYLNRIIKKLTFGKVSIN